MVETCGDAVGSIRDDVLRNAGCYRSAESETRVTVRHTPAEN